MLKKLSKLKLRGFNNKNIKTALWSALETGSAPLFTFLLLPILNHVFGLAGYGNYVLLLAVVTMMGFAGLGSNLAIVKPLAVNLHNSDPLHIARLLGTALWVNLAGTIFFSALLFLLWFSSPAWIASFDWFKQIDQTLIVCLCAMLITTQLDLVTSSTLKGLQFFAYSSITELILRTFGFIALVIVAFGLKNIQSLFICQIIVNLLSVTVRLQLIKKLSGIKFSQLKFLITISQDLFVTGRWMALQYMLWSIYGVVDKLAVGSILGAKEAGIYNILLQFSLLLQLAIMGLFSAIYPKFSRENILIDKRLIKSLILLVLVISMPYVAALIFLKFYIFNYFLIANTFSSVFNALIFSTILMSLNLPFFYIAFSNKNLKKLTAYFALSTLTYTFLLYPLILRYGMLGAVIAKLLGIIILSVLICYGIFKAKDSTI